MNLPLTRTTYQHQSLSKNSQDTIKVNKKKEHDNKSVSKELMNSESSDIRSEILPKPRIILPKSDKKTYDEFKTMLQSYEAGRLNRGRDSDP